jgi:hypothetical protein
MAASSRSPLPRPSAGASIDELHRRVLAGDSAACNETASQLLTSVRRHLHARFPRYSSDWLDEATDDAILDYLRNPQRFDSQRGISLHAYVGVAAVRNVLDRHRAESRRREREARFAAETERDRYRPNPALVRCADNALSLIREPGDLRLIDGWARGVWRGGTPENANKRELARILRYLQRRVRRKHC